MDKDKIQNRYVKQLIKHHESTNKLVLFEAPTGFGKSWVAIKLAKELLKSKKKVIISTHTNKLAFDLKNIAEKLLPDKKIGLIFGKNNYIDINKFLEERNVLQEHCKGVDEYIKILKSKNTPEEYWLVDTFINETLINLDMERIIKSLISANERIKQAGKFENYDISITNHFYLLSNFFFIKNNSDKEEDIEIDKGFNPDNYEIILDEVHTISQTADSLFATSFSPFRFSYLLNEITVKSKDVLSKSAIKLIEKTEKRIKVLTLTHSRKDLVNEYFKSTDDKYQSFFNDLKQAVKRQDLNKLIKYVNSVVAEKPSKLAYDTKKELKELNAVLNSKYGMGFIKYSPTKGYPAIIFQRADGSYALTKMFWDVKKDMFGISATIKPTKGNNPAGLENVLGYRDKSKRLEYVFVDAPYSWGKKQKTYIISKETEIPQTPKVGSVGELDEKSEKDLKDWGGFIANIVTHTYEGKKSIVLTGSYLQVKIIYEALAKLIPDKEIIPVSSDRTMSSIIKQFTADSNIKVLVGARHYGVGVDLPGDLLEKLYIARLPYPVLSFKWLKRRHKWSVDYIDETIINIRQWMGRLLRNEEDRGDLYILDQRIHKKEIWSRIEGFLVERSKEIKFFTLEDL